MKHFLIIPALFFFCATLLAQPINKPTYSSLIEAAEDEIEKEGVLRSRGAVEQADLVVLLSESKDAYPEDLLIELLKLTDEEKIIHVTNKIDLGKGDNEIKDVGISAKTGEGIDTLIKILKEKSFGSETFSEKNILVTNLRHMTALQKASKFLKKSVESIDSGYF